VTPANDPDELRRIARSGASLARGSSALFWAQVVGNTGLFVALLLVTRALGPSGRGTIAFITVAAILLARLARLGVSEATTVFAAQRVPARPALLANVVLSSTVGSIVGATLLCGALAALPEAQPSGIGPEELVLIWLGAVGSALADAGYAFVLGCSRFWLHAIVTATSAWAYAAAVAGVWLVADLTVATAALAWIAVQVLKGFVLLTLAARNSGVARPNVGLLLESLRFGIRGWFGTLSDALNDRLDQLLTAYLASQATLGFYAVAVNASEMLFYLPAAAATAILPVAARERAKGRREQVVGAFRAVGLFTVVAAGVASLLGPLLLPLVFGSPFQESVTPFLLLLPGTVGYLALVVFSNGLLASGAPGRSSLGPVVSLGSTVVLDVVLIPRYGAGGAAAAASMGNLLGGVVALLLFRRLVGFSWRSLVVPRRADTALGRAVVAPLARLVRLRPPARKQGVAQHCSDRVEKEVVNGGRPS
jgi:O-antigen/teichoic acid export membrane protein